MTASNLPSRTRTEQQRTLREKVESLGSGWSEERGDALLALSQSLELEWPWRGSELTESIDTLAEIVHHAPPEHMIRFEALLALARALMVSQTSDSLSQAISHLETALTVVPNSESRLRTLILLDDAESDLAEKTHRLDSDRTIRHLEELVPLMSLGPDRARKTCQLGYAYQSRYESEKDPEDMHSAIRNLRKGFDQPLPNDLRPYVQYDVGRAVFHRFEVTGALVDLESAITIFTNSVNEESLLMHDVYDRLGGALACHYAVTRNIVDIEVAVELRRVAVIELPSVLQVKPSSQTPHVFVLSNLGLSLHQRFIATRNAADLHEAILYQMQALDLPIPPSVCAMVQNRLGCTLFDRYSEFHDEQDALNAISALAQAVEAVPSNTPDLGMFRLNLANVLMAMPQSLLSHQALHSRITKDSAATALRQVAHQSSKAEPSVRLEAALRWARSAHREGMFSNALEGYTTAIDILPVAGWNGLAGRSRAESAERLVWLSCDAASCAIRLGAYEKAIEISEHVRSWFWNGLSQFRTDTAELKKKAPDLAARIHTISSQLSSLSPRFQVASNLVSGNAIHIRPTAESEEHAQNYRRLIGIWDDCVAQARGIQGYETFAQPLSFQQLQHAAKFGPVIILIAGNFHSDALIVRLNEPICHVPLVKATGKEMAELTMKLYTEARKAQPGDVLPEILGILWTTVGIPVLKALGGKKERVWWCPTGQLAFLPIHAAGRYKKSTHIPIKVSQTMFHRVISSYTASLGRLAQAFDQISQVSSQHIPKLMLVGMKERPHYASTKVRALPCVDEEIEAVSSIFSSSHVTRLLDDTSTSTAVLSGLSSHHFIHFACHGSQDWEVPIESGLLLHDKRLSLLDLVMHRSSVGTPVSAADLELVFLSACETSTGSGILPDQAIHLAAGMQFVGFNTVIATLWPIQDMLAPQITKQFYTLLLKANDANRDTEEQPEQLGRDAGVALHDAISNVLKSDPSVSLWHWVPYVHTGI